MRRECKLDDILFFSAYDDTELGTSDQDTYLRQVKEIPALLNDWICREENHDCSVMALTQGLGHFLADMTGSHREGARMIANVSKEMHDAIYAEKKSAKQWRKEQAAKPPEPEEEEVLVDTIVTGESRT